MVAPTNKIAFYFEQIPDYWFHGPLKRFAEDAGIDPTTFSRILKGKTTQPQYRTVCCIVDLLERKLSTQLDPREVFRP